MRTAFLAALLTASAALLLARTPPAGLLFRGDAPLLLPLRPGALDRLSTALTHETVAGNPAAFAALHAYLQASFPAVFAGLTLHTLRPGGGAPPAWLLEWRGRAGLADAPPGILIGHLDVVPGWSPGPGNDDGGPGPFSGHVSPAPDGFITSRGALDAKGPALAMLEAVDGLIASGFRPNRTLFVLLGSDEETGGRGSVAAAAFVAARLASAGAPPAVAFLLDEGGVVLPRPASALGRSLIPGPVFLVGVSEKGWETVRVRVDGRAGHAAQPYPASPGAVLTGAASALHARQPAATCGPACVAAVSAVARASGRPLLKLCAAALAGARPGGWLRAGFAVGAASLAGPTTAATLRPTLALTGLRLGGGPGSAANVVPSSGSAVFNARPAPGDAPGAAAGRVRAAVEAAARELGGKAALADLVITVSTGGRGGGGGDDADFDTAPAPPLTPLAGPGWAALAAAAATLGTPEAGGVLPIPFIVPGATDSRHWAGLAAGVTLRACPLVVPLADVGRVHGKGERVGVGAYLGAVGAYAAFMRVGGGV